MSHKNYVNFHVLTSHSPSCLNRDDMNMQKTAIFGGVRRVRISSQSLKYWMRDSEYYKQHLGKPSVRTNRLDQLIEKFAEELKDEFARDLVEEAIRRFVKAAKAEEGDDEGVDDDTSDKAEVSDRDDATKEKTKKIAVAPWVAAEMREICRVIKAVKGVGLTEDERSKALEKFKKQKPKKKAKKKTEQEFIDEAFDKKIQKALEDSGTAAAIKKGLGKAVDVALSGRMATSGLMTSIDGAMALAHTLTTHAVDSDIDWFTAVDDLTVEAGETGAGHLNTQEMSAGVFYRYASLNVPQLVMNLGEISKLDDPISVEQRSRALGIASHLAHLLATVVPEAKRQSTAADNPADFVLVSFADQPLSLANAFEEAIASRNGFLKPSVEALTAYWQTMNEAYGLNETVAGFSPRFPVGEGVTTFKKLDELKKWIARDGKSP